MKNEMEHLRHQVEDLKTEVIRLQQELKASQLKSVVPQDSDTHLVSEKALHDSDARYQSLFKNMLNGFAYCRMLFEGGLPKDFIYLNVNNAFETLTGLKNVEGKKVSEAIPGIQESDPEVMEIYGRVALTGKPERFEIYMKALNAWFNVSVYSPQKEYFVAVFDVITERKQAEEALRESEDRFRMLVESAPMGIFTTISSGQVLSINLAMARILDFPSPKEALEHYTNLSDQLYVHAERRDEFLRLLRDFSRVEDFEYQARTAAGRIIWLSMNARVSGPREDGSFIIEGFAADITERKRAETALRESEERHRHIVESSTDAILVRSGEVVIYANPAALKIFRAKHMGDLVGKRYLDLIHPDDRAESAERVRKGRNEKWIAPPREHRIVAMDGQVVNVESTGVPVQYQGETQVFGVFRDITERKQVDEKLRETEKKYRELAESLPQVIFEVDLNGTLKYVNQTGHQLFGYTPEEISKGFNVLEAFIPEDRERVALDIMLNIQGQRLGRQDYTAVRKDGTKFPAGVHASRVMSGTDRNGCQRNPY